MVANHNIKDDGRNPKTLGYWVKQFRSKKREIKRKLNSGSNLRVCAILSTTLMMAELELQRKQQERIQKWFEFQPKIEKSLGRHYQHRTNQSKEKDAENRKQSEEIAKLWKCELSDLDKFMRSISSSNNESSYDNKENNQLHSVRVFS